MSAALIVAGACAGAALTSLALLGVAAQPNPLAVLSCADMYRELHREPAPRQFHHWQDTNWRQLTAPIPLDALPISEPRERRT